MVIKFGINFCFDYGNNSSLLFSRALYYFNSLCPNSAGRDTCRCTIGKNSCQGGLYMAENFHVHNQ